VRRHGIERGIVALGRVEQLLEPRAEKEQRHIRINGLGRLRRIVHADPPEAILDILTLCAGRRV
jgi:hypothetical protein